jgi:hypothetical protein
MQPYLGLGLGAHSCIYLQDTISAEHSTKKTTSPAEHVASQSPLIYTRTALDQ